MTTYAQQNLGSNLSQVVAFDDSQDEAIRSFERGGTEPSIKPAGLLWSCTNGTVLSGLGLTGVTEAMLRWNGSAWTLFAVITSGAGAASVLTLPILADIPMANHKLTGLSAGSAAGHSVRYEQVMLISGANAMAGDLDLDGNEILNLAAPTDPASAARLQDVEDAVADLGTAAGEVSFSSNSSWSDVSVGFDWQAVTLRVSSTGTSQPAASGELYTFPVFVRLAADGSGAVTLKFAEGDTLGVPFHALEFQRQSNGFRVRRAGGVSETITVRWMAVGRAS